MRLLVVTGLLLALAGCAGPGPPESPASEVAEEDAGRLAELRGDGEFSGIETVVTTVRHPGGTQTDFFHEGDPAIEVEDGATSVNVTATLSTATPEEWEMCVTQGDPHAGVCVTGTGTLQATVNATTVRSGDWKPWFFLPDGAIPAGAGAAVEIRWTAVVFYA